MKTRGFTIIELVISSAILLMLIIAALATIDVSRTSLFIGDASVELRQEIIKAFTRMEKELKETRPAQISLTAGMSGSTLAFRVPTDKDLDGTILDSQGSIEWSDSIVYALNEAHQLTRTAAGKTHVLANNIRSVQFNRPAATSNLLEIDIVAEKTTPSQNVMRDSGEIMLKMRN
ncbi:MAG: prepilin-type N-terminal cleavage/methylation domain-containing protein [Candidatus Omnitrophica bacterium]|nr:prepilin-type N-terminal cleavage/methylation domain-containing protein [Candidatus Omnitrophota bacterium]